MAFGTGKHATTRMAAKLVCEWSRPGDRVLDAGSGTGILAMAALHKGAQYALCIDIEEDAVREARQNFARNEFAGKTKVFQDSILSAKLRNQKFDLVLANIHLNVLKQWLPQIPEILSPNGRVILTGLLVGQGKKLGHSLGAASIRRIMGSWIVLGYQI